MRVVAAVLDEWSAPVKVQRVGVTGDTRRMKVHDNVTGGV